MHYMYWPVILISQESQIFDGRAILIKNYMHSQTHVGMDNRVLKCKKHINAQHER